MFDFFGVFSTPPATNWFKKAVPGDDAKLREFQALCTQSDYGLITRAEMIEQAAELAGGLPVAAVEKGMQAETRLNTELVAYAQKLKQAGYHLACVSNGTKEWTLRVMDDFGIRDLFDEIVLSGDLGMIKPYPEIYRYALDKVGVKPAEALFIDDRKDNVDGADACGIRGLVFEETAAFIHELEAILKQDNPAFGKA